MEIIAEIGQNFNGDIDLAVKLILAAKKCGADIAKFQLYNARELFPKESNPWYEYNCKTELSFGDVTKLKQACDENDIEFMASPFDSERVDWLEELNVKRYKLASRSIKDDVLIDKVLQTGKPALVSLGMWDGADFPKIDGKAISFLYCISKYPTPLEDVNLRYVDFNKYTGFSDHTIGITAPCVAMSRGAKIIEKHFTLDKQMHGPDHECSMTPTELKQICQFRDELERCL